MYGLTEAELDRHLYGLSSGTWKLTADCLDQEKILTTENGDLRDWNGLLDYSPLSAVEKSRFSTDDKTVKILTFWSKRREQATVKDLFRALTKIDREDLKQALVEPIKRDCQRPEISFADFSELTSREEFRTRQDLELMHQGNRNEMIKYDALVIYGEEDHAFAKYVINRMEDIGLKVLWPQRDFLGGMLSIHATSDLIATRVNKVVVICSESTFKDPQNILDIEMARQHWLRTQRAIVMPVIYSWNVEIPNMDPWIKSLFKLQYKPWQSYFNFWKKLIVEGFEWPTPLTKDQLQMDFEAHPSYARSMEQNQPGHPTSRTSSHASTSNRRQMTTTTTTGNSSTSTMTMDEPLTMATNISDSSSNSTTRDSAALIDHEPPTQTQHNPPPTQNAVSRRLGKMKSQLKKLMKDG